ncbi:MULTISPECIES: hypothetical protein [unclassified Aeromicrobium]|jgi:hypothetical protein|uniref:hypothetical protein n=1 Tax=unclassified Aeromicrobium TaxID=2633570 RepID=UPI000AC224B9|nr:MULTISPECIES: hypothetical protein [unclassified Aeromicrobium]
MTELVRTLPAARHDHVEVQVRRALRLLALGWDTALSAVLADDPRVARTVLRTAPARRQAVRVAEERARHDGDGAVDLLPLLAESEQVNRLLARLAQTVLTEHDRPLVDDADRTHIIIARRRGTERLCHLAGTPHLPVASDDVHTCTTALLRVRDHLRADEHEHSPAAHTCGDLTAYLLEIARHSARSGTSSPV